MPAFVDRASTTARRMPGTPGRTLLTREQFRELTRPLIGMPISLAEWVMDTTIRLELGTLTRYWRRSGNRLRSDGDGQVRLVLEWNWRVESAGAIQFGSWSSDRRLGRGVESLQGHTIAGVELEGRLPELVLALDGKRWLHTFMTAEGQPAWAIRLPGGAWLGVHRGRLYRQAPRWEWEDAGPTSVGE